jgi:hypothetical protein
MHLAPGQGTLECVYLPFRGVLQGQVQGRAPPEGPGVAVVGPLRWMDGERLELLVCCTTLYLYSADCLGVPACSCPKCTHLLHSSGVGGESNGCCLIGGLVSWFLLECWRGAFLGVCCCPGASGHCGRSQVIPEHGTSLLGVRGHLLAVKQHKWDCGFGRVVVLAPFGTHTLSVSTQPCRACGCSIVKGVWQGVWRGTFSSVLRA